jgi:hypothetical protein
MIHLRLARRVRATAANRSISKSPPSWPTRTAAYMVVDEVDQVAPVRADRHGRDRGHAMQLGAAGVGDDVDLDTVLVDIRAGAAKRAWRSS